MIQIDDVVVTLDVLREKFICDLGVCKGACCIEGDAGAPVEKEEVAKLEEVLPIIWDDLADNAKEIINEQQKHSTKSINIDLSDREKDILLLVAEGLNNKEIAEKLFLSEGTVRNYISIMLEKLSLRDRTQLAIYYYKQ